MKKNYHVSPTNYQFYLYPEGKSYPSPYIWCCNITIAGDIGYIRGVDNLVKGAKDALREFAKEISLKEYRWERYDINGNKQKDIVFKAVL